MKKPLTKLFASTVTTALCLLVGGCNNDGPSTSVPEFYSGNSAVPVTGSNVAGAEPFDQAVSTLLKKWNIPGAALAIAKDGRLILARGYGYADFEAKQLMQPDSMSRIASNSKVLTSMAILHLKDQGQLNLDEKFLDILTQYPLPANGDVRIRDITIRHLLQHAGGWDRSISGDPPFLQKQIASALGIPTPVLCPDIVRYMVGQPLDFVPGTKHVYSNLGYCVLGLIVEKVSGEPYELHVRNQVLAPMDVHAMSIGYTPLSQRGPYEVKYYEYDGAPLVDSVFPGEGKVPAPYGGYEMLAMAPAGGWVGSAIDLTRIMTAIDGRRISQFLSPNTMLEYTANPQLPGYSDPRYWYGLGILVGPTPDTWSHNGSLSGVRSLSAHRRDGYNWAITTNSRAIDGINGADLIAEIVSAISPLLDVGLHGSSSDLYQQYPSPSLPARYR